MIDARDVTAVVVTYTRLPLLRRCLAALQGQTVQGLRVLVVDLSLIHISEPTRRS